MRRVALLSLAALASCTREPPRPHAEEHHEESEHDSHEAPAGEGLLKIDPGMLRDLRITVAAAKVRPAGEGVTLLGELAVDQARYAEVTAPIAARVSRVLAGEGEQVRAGQALAELESPELGRARAAVVAATARAELARKARERKRGLVAERVSPAREAEEADAEAEAAEAELRGAAAALRALGAEAAAGEGAGFAVRSAIRGVVLERSAVVGRMADPYAPLFRVAELSRLWLRVHAFERDAVRLSRGAVARVSVPALPGQTFTATVTLVGAEVDVRSRTIPVRLEVASPGGVLRPGMSASAWVPITGGDTSVVSVPAAALQRTERGWTVFIPKDRSTFEPRAVGRGRDLGTDVEIVSGLERDERVVVEGAFLLKAEADKARGGGEAHEH